MIRVFLLARHAGLAEMLALLLSGPGADTLTVVGSSGFTLDGVQRLAELRPEIVLLAVGLDALNELHLAAVVRSLSPRTGIVVVDTMGEASRVLHAYPQPVDGMLAVAQATEQLAALIRTVAAQRAAASGSGGHVRQQG